MVERRWDAVEGTTARHTKVKPVFKRDGLIIVVRSDRLRKMKMVKKEPLFV